MKNFLTTPLIFPLRTVVISGHWFKSVLYLFQNLFNYVKDPYIKLPNSGEVYRGNLVINSTFVLCTQYPLRTFVHNVRRQDCKFINNIIQELLFQKLQCYTYLPTL